ncbi:MAG: hypothetical protein R3E31_24860 [Chloroflexota bacterium]
MKHPTPHTLTTNLVMLTRCANLVVALNGVRAVKHPSPPPTTTIPANAHSTPRQPSGQAWQMSAWEKRRLFLCAWSQE